MKDKPKNIECAKELFPDVWVYPEIVCLIRADEITMSPLHSAGKTKEQLGYAYNIIIGPSSVYTL